MRASGLSLEEPLILAGDYNVIPTPADVHESAGLDRRRAVPAADPRRSSASLINLGLTDAFRATSDDPGLYTFWDYQAGAWQKNNGIRIDHLLLSPQAADRLSGRRHRQPCAHVGKAFRSRAGVDRSGYRGEIVSGR